MKHPSFPRRAWERSPDALRPVTLSLLSPGRGASIRHSHAPRGDDPIVSGRRSTAPAGLAGGQSGQPGRNRWLKANGDEEVLGSTDRCQVEPGDAIVIETPGGGGYGPPSSST